MAEHTALKAKYQALVDLATLHVQTQPEKKIKRGKTAEKRPLDAIDAEIDAFEVRFTKIQQQRTKTSLVVVGERKRGSGENSLRWRRWQGEWTPRALGVAV